MKHEELRQRFGNVIPADNAVDVLDAVEKWLIERESKQLHKPDVMPSLPLFRQLFDELINAGRDMERRDRMQLHYLPEDEYYDNVVKRYLPNGNEA